MRRKLVVLGVILLVLAGAPLLYRIFSARSILQDFLGRFTNGATSNEPQIPLIAARILFIILQSIGIEMGIIITVVGAISSPSKEECEPVKNTEGICLQ